MVNVGKLEFDLCKEINDFDSDEERLNHISPK